MPAPRSKKGSYISRVDKTTLDPNPPNLQRFTAQVLRLTSFLPRLINFGRKWDSVLQPIRFYAKVYQSKRLAKPVRAALHSLHVVACGSRSNSTQGAHCGAPAGGGGLARRRYNTSIRITQILHSLVHRRIVDVAAGRG